MPEQQNATHDPTGHFRPEMPLSKAQTAAEALKDSGV